MTWWWTANEKEHAQGGGAGLSPAAYTWGALWRTFALQQATTAGGDGDQDEEKPKDRQNLAKVLKVWDLMAYGIGSTVGAGIFVVTGVVAREKYMTALPSFEMK